LATCWWKQKESFIGTTSDKKKKNSDTDILLLESLSEQFVSGWWTLKH